MHSTTSRAVRLARAAAVVLLVAGCKDSNAPDKVGPPTDLVVSAGDNQQGPAGTALLAPIAAKVTDAKGHGIAGVEVTFIVPAGNGTVDPTSAQTNSAGVATATWTLPGVLGNVAVRANAIDPSSGALIDTVSFHAKVVGGPPSYFYMSSVYQDRAATGTTIPVKLIAYDRFGNPSSGATVTWTVTAGGGTVSAPTSVTDAAGGAQVSFTLGSTGTLNTLRATSGTATYDISILGVVRGKAASVAAVSPPAYIGPNQTVALTAVVFDGLGNPVKDSTVQWSVTAGGGSVAASTSVTDAQGRATMHFTSGSTLGTNTILATIGGVTATFSIQTKNIVAAFGTRAFGIGRTSGGVFAVSLIDAGQVEIFDQATATTPRSVSVGGTPVVVAIDAAESNAWISNMAGWVDIVPLAAGGTATKVSVPNAHSLTRSPSGDRMYVTSTAGLVYAVSTATQQVVGSVSVPNGPWGITFKSTATDSLMYVTSRDGGTITEINTKTLGVLRTITVGGRPHGIVISPDQSTLYVADDQGAVKAVSIASGTVTSSVAVSGAFGIAISPDGSTLYVTTNYGQGVVLTASSLAITKTVTLNGAGRQVITSPDGSTAWAATEGGTVDIINK